jgi:hypothetical protein
MSVIQRIPREYRNNITKKLIFISRRDFIDFIDNLRKNIPNLKTGFYIVSFPKKNQEIMLDNGEKRKWQFDDFRPTVWNLYAYAPPVQGMDAFFNPSEKRESDPEKCNYCEGFYDGKLVLRAFLNKLKTDKRSIKHRFGTTLPNPIIWGYLYKKNSPELFEQIKDISKDYHYSRFANRQLLPRVIIIYILVILALVLPFLYVILF